MLRKFYILESGVLPQFTESQIISPGEFTKILDLKFREVFTFDKPYLFSAIHKNLSILMLEREFFKFDLKNLEIIKTYEFSRMIGPSIGFKKLIVDKVPNRISLFDFQKDILLWQKDINESGIFPFFQMNEKVIIGSQIDFHIRHGYNVLDGNIFWTMTPNELDLELPISKFSPLIRFKESFVGLTSNREYYAFNALDKSQIWTRKLPAKTKGQVVISDRYHHSINIVDFFSRERKVKYHEFIYIVLDLKNGELIKEIDISEQLYLKGFIDGDGTEGPSFSQMAANETHIFFAIENKLLAMEMATGDLEEIYEHDTKFYFSKFAHNMLFYTDDKFRCLVFKEEHQVA